MINVKFKNNGFKVEGHALFANYGSDIVCSAVSAITIGTINEIIRLSNEENIILDTNEDEGIIDFSVIKISKEIQVLLNFCQNTLSDVAKSYSKNIKILN